MLYLINKPKLDPISKTKLPKGKLILQRLEGLLLESKTSDGVVQNQKKQEILTDCVKAVSKECVDVWKHHFGLRVIEGKEYEAEVITDEQKSEKKMIEEQF